MRYILLISLAIFYLSCNKGVEQTVVLFDNPGSNLGSEPNLHLTDDGTLYLSWIQAIKGENSKLYISTLNDETLVWSSQIS